MGTVEPTLNSSVASMANRLAQSQSLYLQKHAENPIDWWPWCDEALQKAKRENKPIFLSIGYSSCHWCTVMEGEAFSNAQVAQYMNSEFVPIKVDREERPDIDSIYMQALQLMTGQGGWPLNVFLSPDDLVPFYGGTYFPLEPKYGRPGFVQVLQAIRRLYNSDRTKVNSVKEEILERLQQSGQLPAGDKLDAALLHMGLNYSAGILSSGGYGPSFPMIPYADAALHGCRFGNSEASTSRSSDRDQPQYDAKQIATQRGMNLALGGIYDHVGGGFHRYTVDPTWTVPHFEKMLYDNGQIMEYLANLWSLGVQEPAFKRAIAGTAAWLKREMTAPEGYFYAAQDADSFVTPADVEPEEGAFYVWRYSELSEMLTDTELTELSNQFTISVEGNFEGKTVLQRRHPGELSQTVETILNKLFRVRYGAHPDTLSTMPPARNNQAAKEGNWAGRIPCVTDTKLIVAWNSLMISGLARAYLVFRDSKYLDMASTAAEFIWQQQRSDGQLHRVNYDGKVAVSAQSEDYALLIKALLDLDQAYADQTPAGQSSQWLERALVLQEEFDERLWSIELGGYFNTVGGDDLLLWERSYQDNATPSANGIAIANLIRLALLSENLSYLDRAEQGLLAFTTVMEQAPSACPSLFTALDWFQHHTLIRTDCDRISHLLQIYLPTAVCKSETVPTGAVGLVCQGLSCQEPAQSDDQLQAQLYASQQRSV